MLSHVWPLFCDHPPADCQVTSPPLLPIIVVSFGSVVGHTAEWRAVQTCMGNHRCKGNESMEQMIRELISGQEGDLLQDHMPPLLDYYGWSEVSLVSMVR